jgi:O-antigen/teichoic acid export membrane protein
MKRLFKTTYAKNVLTLITGTTIAQLIPIAITPILSRLFTPADFGVFALYSSILYVLSVFVSGRYEFAILLPKKNSDGMNLVALSGVIAICVSLFFFIITLFFKSKILHLLNSELLSSWIYIIPFSLFGMGILQSFNYYVNRRKRYKVISYSRIYRSISTSTISLVSGLVSFAPGGLILGDLVGQIFAAFYLMRNTLREDADIVQEVSKEQMKVVGARYINFPKFQILSGFLEKCAGQAPVFLLTAFFSPAIVGFFSLSQRVIISPSALISGAMGDVFRQQASEEYVSVGNSIHVFKKTFKRLFLIATIPFFIGYFIIEDLFAFVLGEEWRVAGQYAKIMMPMFYLQFIVSPLSVMFVVAEKQKYDLLMQVFLFAGCVTAFYYYQNSEFLAITSFTIIYCLKYVVEFFLSYKFALGKKGHIPNNE